MSDVAANVQTLAEECIVRACWRQWRVLTGESREADARSIIDPEALVLASLSVRDREARLRDLLLWWASTGAHLMSVSRIKTMKELFMEDLTSGLAWFSTQTGDARWSSLGGHEHGSEPARPGKGPKDLYLLGAPALMIRLRAGFGVGAKADLLAFLLGASTLRGQNFRATASAISKAIQFSPSAVRRATKDMCLAGMIRSSRGRTPTYSVDAQAWADLLCWNDPYRRSVSVAEGNGSPDLPRWRFWGYVYPLLAACAWWGRGAHADGAHPVVMASLARDITESFAHLEDWNDWPTVDARAAPGERFLDVFYAFVERLTTWVDAST